MADWIEEIEGISNTRYIELDDGTFFNCHIDRLIAEVKRLREENTALRNDKERIECENNQFRRYVIETGCSCTQTESDCECDYEYPWPCDHCPIVEHNRTIDAEMDSEWEIEFIR